MWQVEDTLVVRIRMNGGDKTLFNPEVFMQYLGDGGQAVCSTGGIGNYAVF